MMTGRKSRFAICSGVLFLTSCVLGGSFPVRAQTATPTPVLTPPATVTTMNAPVPVKFKPYNDPWGHAVERWWDISTDAEKQFDAFLGKTGEVKQTFSYGNANVVLTYDTAPSSPFFVAHVKATGLKPNFCYQLKLVGKPTRGSRGWGSLGDDTANEEIGTHGRWWCDSSHSTETNFNDEHYLDFYKNAPGNGNPVHNIYGYLYTGMFVTDSWGEADVYFTGEYNFHVTWRQGQNTDAQDHFAGEWLVQGGWRSDLGAYYGYGGSAPGSSTTVPTVKLWYEYEYQWTGDARSTDGRANLKNGTYSCRFLITEESFHEYNWRNPGGGRWKTVLGTEDYTYNADNTVSPDTDRANDIVFTLGGATTQAAAPANLKATAGDAKVSLTWDKVNYATSYNVKRSTISGGEYQLIASGITTSFTDRDVTNGDTYYYVVSAANAGGEGANSAEASATPLGPNSPAAPSGLAATAASTSQINLAWTDNSTEDEFKIERSTDGINFTRIATVAANTKTYVSSGLAEATTYTYRVRAYSVSGGNSAYSNTSSATTHLAAPTTLTATAISATENKLSWTDNSGSEDGFKIERATNGTTFTEIATVGANITGYANTDVTDGATYTYRVRAYKAAINSAYSNTVSLPARPTGLTATAVSKSQINLQWTDNSTNETGFKIEQSTDGSSFTQIATVGAGTTKYSSTRLSRDRNYWYRVRAYNGAGNSFYSDAASARTFR